MHVSVGSNQGVQRVHVRVDEAGQMDVFLSMDAGFITLSESELGMVLKVLEERRQAGDGAVQGGENVVRLALADALRTRGIDADEYAAGLAWLEERKQAEAAHRELRDTARSISDHVHE